MFSAILRLRFKNYLSTFYFPEGGRVVTAGIEPFTTHNERFISETVSHGIGAKKCPIPS